MPRRKKASFASEWLVCTGAEGMRPETRCTRIFMNFFHRAPSSQSLAQKEEKRAIWLDREVKKTKFFIFFFFFLQVTYGVGEFFCSSSLWFTFNSGRLLRDHNHLFFLFHFKFEYYFT